MQCRKLIETIPPMTMKRILKAIPLFWHWYNMASPCLCAAWLETSAQSCMWYL